MWGWDEGRVPPPKPRRKLGHSERPMNSQGHFHWSRKEGGQGAGLNTSSFCRKEKQCALCLEQAGHGEDAAEVLHYWEQRAYRSREDEDGTAGKQLGMCQASGLV